MNKLVYILSLSLLILSCKKENVAIDREADMLTDSAHVVYGIRYLSNTATSMQVEVDMLYLRGLKPATTYPSGLFSETSYATDVTYSLPVVTQSPISNTGYNSVLLFNLNRAEWYSEHYFGYYLRRFLEQIDGVESKKVALSSFAGQQNTLTRFHSENGGVLFDNSWEYSMEEFYTLTKYSGSPTYMTSFSVIKNQLLNIIDTMAVSSEISNDLSITLVSTTDFEGSADPEDVDEVINAALAEQCKINLIGFTFPSHMKRIANETGGFVADYPEDVNTGQVITDSTSQVSNVIVSMQNLDNLLAGDVKVNRATYQFDLSNGSNYTSGDLITYPFEYNGYKYFIDLRIP